MASTPVPPLNRRLCRGLAWVCRVCLVFFLLCLLANATLWLVPGWAAAMAPYFFGPQSEMITMTPMVRVIGLTSWTLYLVVLLRGLWIAAQIFGHLGEGRVFEAQTGVLLRRFGLTLLLYAVLQPFLGFMTALMIAMQKPPHNHAQFGVGDPLIVMVIVGTLIMMTGSVMAEAARLAEDNRQII